MTSVPFLFVCVATTGGKENQNHAYALETVSHVPILNNLLRRKLQVFTFGLLVVVCLQDAGLCTAHRRSLSDRIPEGYLPYSACTASFRRRSFFMA